MPPTLLPARAGEHFAAHRDLFARFYDFDLVASTEARQRWIPPTLEPLDSFGRNGVAPGEFYVMHHMNVDWKGNLYVTEVQDGKRIQKFQFKGYTTTPGTSH